jgi:hypothetical protein
MAPTLGGCGDERFSRTASSETVQAELAPQSGLVVDLPRLDDPAVGGAEDGDLVDGAQPPGRLDRAGSGGVASSPATT